MFCARPLSRIAIFAALAALPLAGQTRAKPRRTIEIQSVRVVSGDTGPVLEIVASSPLTPKMQTVEGPLRLVVDLPDSTLNTPRKRIPFRNAQIKGVRMDQYQANPAVARVVIDLGRRPFLSYNVALKGRIGTLESEVIEEFWRALSIHLGATIHVDLIRGRNRHHIAEATFKALGLALRAAMAAGGAPGVPSSKGVLG